MDESDHTGSGANSEDKSRRSQSREFIDTHRDKGYVRRDDEGRFNESDDQGRSLAQDRRTKAKKKARPGQGDRGDHG